MKTTTIISVLYKDYGLFEYMIRTALATSDNIEQILICDNGSNNHLYKRYDDRVRFISGVGKPHNGSVSHGLGLNRLLPMVKTPITAIIEPDVLMLDRGWDELPDHIDYRASYKTEYQGVFCYLPCFVVGLTDKLQKIDFAPGGKGIACSSTEMFNDVGWRMAAADMVVQQLKFKRCENAQCSIIPNGVFSKKTNEFWLNDRPIAAHLWRGSDPEKRGPKHKEDFQLWKDTAEKILQRVSK